MQPGEKASLRDGVLFFCIIAFIIGIVGIGVSKSFLFIMLAMGGFGGILTILVTPQSHDVVKERSEQNRSSALNQTVSPPRTAAQPVNLYQSLPNRTSPEQERNSRELNPTVNYPAAHSKARSADNDASDILEVRGHVIYQHAFEAIHAVSETVDKSQPLPIDMGLIVYRGTDKPAIYRTHDVPDDADTIQPYVQLHMTLPLVESASVKVRFEITNSSEQVLFSHEQNYTLKDNLNLITPPARLAISDLNKNYLWELRLSVGDKLLARHLFAWGEAPTEEVVNALEADGEISDEMRDLLEEQAEQPLSLDDLLANDIDQQKQQGS